MPLGRFSKTSGETGDRKFPLKFFINFLMKPQIKLNGIIGKFNSLFVKI
jgi:hypothetical protein